MKITKNQLKRIIREERSKLIREAKRRGLREQEEVAPATAAGVKPHVGQAKTKSVMQAGEKVWYALSTIIDQAMDQSDPSSWIELANDLRGLADDVEDSIPEGS